MAKANSTNTAPRNSNATDGVGVKTKTYFVWLKNRAYLNDTERVEAGVFMLKEVPERFKKLSANVCEVFENAIPSRKVAHIARWAGIDPDGMEDKEILAKVITKLSPFL